MKKIVKIIWLILLLGPFAVQAQESGSFGFSVDCEGGCKDKKINISKDILLEFTISNDLDYWISFGEESRYKTPGSDIRIEVYHEKLEGGKQYYRYENILGRGFFIEPHSELKIYLPLYIYNDMTEDSKVGEWKIIPRLELDAIKYYPSDFSEVKTVYAESPIKSSIAGNELKFEAVYPEVKIAEEGEVSIPSWVKEDIRDTVKGVIIGVFVLVISSYVIHKKRKKKIRVRKIN